MAPLWTSVPPATYGGTELVIHCLTEELVLRGHDVTLFASGDSKTTAKLQSITEHSIIQAMTRGAAYSYEHYVNASLADAILTSGSFDIIHCHLGFAQIPLAALATTPVLYSPHVIPSVDDVWALRHYPGLRISAISQHQANAMSLAGSKNIPVIHHGIDFTRYKFSQEKGKYLTFLGRMGPQKSPLHAIRIAAAVGMPITLAGKPQNAQEQEYFSSEIMPLIDGMNVNYVGLVNHEQKNELLRNAAALLFPIQGEEAFGLVMIEAMACGTPAVATDCASVREIIDVGTTGFYAKSTDHLLALIPQAIGLDRNTVRDHAMRRFSHQRMVDDYLEAYNSLLSV